MTAGMPIYGELEFRTAVRRRRSGRARHPCEKDFSGAPDLLACPAAISDDEIGKLRQELSSVVADPSLRHARKALRLTGTRVLEPGKCRRTFQAVC